MATDERAADASRRPSADAQEPRPAFSQRPPHSPAHRRRARADRRRRRSSRSARGGELSPSCSRRAPAGSIAIEYDRALAAMLRERYARRRTCSSSRRTCSRSSSASSRAGRFVSSATFRTTSRRRSSFTPSSRRAPSAPCISCSARSRDRSSRAPGTQGIRRASVNVQAVATAEDPVPRRAADRFSRRRRSRARSSASSRAPIRCRRPRKSDVPRFVLDASACVGSRCGASCARLAVSTPKQADALLASAGIEPSVRPETLSAGAVRRAPARCRNALSRT